MAYSESYCDSYFQKFANMSQPIYIWGENITLINDPVSEAQRLYKLYGSSTGQYNETYYSQKCQQAYDNHTYASDCSGFFAEISGNDMTASGYYSSCLEKGSIDSIDLSHSCLVFRGSSTKISHVGYYCKDGYTYEMSNSNDNFRKQLFNKKNWTYWGKPTFIDYSVSTSISSVSTYLYKGIDISTYQKNVDYRRLKDAGVQFAILKIIRKDLNPDNMFEIHYYGCVTNGIDVSCYNYSYATTIEQARQAANAVLNVLNGRKMPVYLDVEDNVQKGLGEYLADIINAYQEVIERAGLIFGVYTGMSFYNSYLSPYRSKIKCKNWHIARYYKGYTEMPFDEDPDELYKPSMLTTSWQYTSSGKVSGINGRVDLDVMYALPQSSPIIVPTPSIPANVKLNSLIRNTVQTGGKNLNVRTKPSTDGQIIGKLPNNTNVVIYGTDKEGKWARISVPNSEWCSLEYISSTGRGMVTAEKSLYVRSSDSTNGEIWGVYKSGEVVTILHQSTNTGWYLTVGKSKDGALIGGWCSNKYIRTQ